MRNLWVLTAVVTGLSIIAVTPCFGQAFTANLTGVLTDPNGARVPAAPLHLRNTATGEARQSASTIDGRYTFSQLLPGEYELRVVVAGFRPFVQHGILLRANQSAELDVALQLGEVSQTVEVSAAVAVLDTQTANQSASFGAQQLTDLPSSLRSPFGVVFDTVGVISVSQGQESQNNQDQFRNRYAMNGGREMSGLTLLDGVPAGGGDFGGLMVSPGTDSVQEVQVIRGSYDAQFGKSGGGVVSIVTKGGSDSFHGTGFEFFRSDNLDANSWANNRFARPKTDFRRDQFGGNFSGPAWQRQHLYFFAGYERLRQDTPSNITATVPTALERTGDFSQSFNSNGTLQSVFDPFSIRPNPAGAGFVRDPFPGNKISATRFDKVGLNVVNLYPAPTADGAKFTHVNNFFGTGTAATRDYRLDSRIDWAHNQKHTLYARATYALQNQEPALFFGKGADTGAYADVPRFQTTVGNTIIPNPTLVVNVLIGIGRYRQPIVTSSQKLGIDGTSVGLPASLVSQFAAPTLPTFTIANYNTLGNARYLNFPRETHNAQVNVTKEKGAHSIKFGFMMELARLNSIDVRSADFAFDRGMTSGPVAVTSSSTSGNSIASLLLGTGSDGSAPKTVTPATTQMYYSWYVQDTWRVSRRLTLNAGLRYEIQKPRTERYNQYNYFDFTVKNPVGAKVGLPINGGLVFVTDADRGQTQTDYLDFAPRVGMAFKLTNKLVMRGGYGISYLPAFGEAEQGGPAAGTDGFSTTSSWVASQAGDHLHPADLISNPFPNGLTQPVGSKMGLETLTGESVIAVQRPHTTPYMQNYSVDFQYELRPRILVELGYTGTVGRKLTWGIGKNANQLPASALALGAQLDTQVPNPFYGTFTRGVLSGATVPRNRLLRPFPQYDIVDLSGDTPGASSGFNSLVAKYTQQFSSGLTLISSYQWSKAIDNASESQGWITQETFRDYGDAARDRSISGHDVPHSFATSLFYKLPIGKGQKYGSAMPRVAQYVLGGWQVSGAVRFQSGFPFYLMAPNTLAAYGFGGGQKWNPHRPNVANLTDLNVETRTPERWFNTDAVKAPAPYTVGNAPRYMPNLRSAGSKHANVAIMKDIAVSERFKMQFRGESFNVTNTPQFAAPANTLGAGTFGTVSNTTNVGARTIQLGVKAYF